MSRNFTKRIARNRTQQVAEQMAKIARASIGDEDLNEDRPLSMAEGARDRLVELGSERIILPPKPEGWPPFQPWPPPMPKPFPHIQARQVAEAEAEYEVRHGPRRDLTGEVLALLHGQDGDILNRTRNRDGEPMLHIVIETQVRGKRFRLYNDIPGGFRMQSSRFDEYGGVVNGRAITVEDLDRGWGLASDYQRRQAQ